MVFKKLPAANDEHYCGWVYLARQFFFFCINRSLMGKYVSVKIMVVSKNFIVCSTISQLKRGAYFLCHDEQT